MLNDDKIRQFCIANNMVSPFDESLLNGNSIDLTLGDSLKLDTESGWYNIDISGQPYYMNYGEFVLGSTREYIKMPLNKVGIICGKSTVARSGLQIESAGLVDSGFEGQLTLELFYMRKSQPFSLKPNIRIAQLYVFDTDSPQHYPYDIIGNYNKQIGPTLPKTQ